MGSELSPMSISCIEWQCEELREWRDDFLRRLDFPKPTQSNAMEFQMLRRATDEYMTCIAICKMEASNVC